jgi:hypothetical protein
MELANTPMTERQRKYRENYRERVAGWYNGWLHILLIYTIGFTALYVYIPNLHDVRWWEFLAVVFMFANFFERGRSPLRDAPPIQHPDVARDP